MIRFFIWVSVSLCSSSFLNGQLSWKYFELSKCAYEIDKRIEVGLPAQDILAKDNKGNEDFFNEAGVERFRHEGRILDEYATNILSLADEIITNTKL